MLKGIWNESQHIKAHIRSLSHVFAASCLNLTLVVEVCQKAVDYIIIVHIHVLLPAFATKLPGGTLFGARSSGPDSCGIGMPNNIWLHHHRSHTCASTCLCYKVAWGHSVQDPKFGARSSGPDSCGTGMPKNIWLHNIQNSLTCASTYMPLLQSCLGAFCSGPEVRGPKFGARLLWHRYAKKHLIT